VCNSEYIGELMYFDEDYTAEVVQVHRRYKEGNTTWTLRLRRMGNANSGVRHGEEIKVLRSQVEECLNRSRKDPKCGARFAKVFDTQTHFGWIVAGSLPTTPTSDPVLYLVRSGLSMHVACD
jgi:hypothetical protein